MIIKDLHNILPHEVSPMKIDEYGDEILRACDEFGIDTDHRKAAFFAQILHESGHLNYVRENLNYKTESLQKVFKKYFPTLSDAAKYARDQVRIANKVYAGRMGNGDEASGDGYRFRGRGFIQITGKYNYETCGEGLGKDLIANPDYLETAEGAARSAAWYWKHKKLNALADKKDIKAITKAINGGYIGLADREHLYKNILEKLGL
jgi:putative chitinase